MYTELPMEESIKMTEDSSQRRTYVHCMANHRIKDGEGTEQSPKGP